MHTAGLRVTFLALVVAAAAMLVFAVPASAATKPYSLVICANPGSNQPAVETCGPSQTVSANQPAGVPADQSAFPTTAAVPMTATFVNENKVGTGLNLGSANLTAPTGFTVTGASLGGSALAACISSTPATTSCLNGNTVELRSVGLVPGATMTLNMTVTPPSTLAACTVASPCAWSVLSKQSNDFSGNPGNNLNVDPATSTLNTVLAQLQFGHVGNALVNTAITSNDYAPGSPVTVNIVDGATKPNAVLSYNGPVTVALTLNGLTFGGSGAALGGTVTENALNGVASFPDLNVDVAGSGFALTASTLDPPPSGPQQDLPPSTTSNTFNVSQAASVCKNNGQCQQIDAPFDFASLGGIDGKASATVSFPTGTPAPELTETADFGTPAQQQAYQSLQNSAACNYYYADNYEWVGNTVGSATLPTSTDTTLITASITTTVVNVTGSTINGQDDCFVAAVPNVPPFDGNAFQVQNETAKSPPLVPATQVTLPDGTIGFAGILADCGKKSSQVQPSAGPCVVSRTGNALAGTLTITISSPFDFWHSG